MHLILTASDLQARQSQAIYHQPAKKLAHERLTPFILTKVRCSLGGPKGTATLAARAALVAIDRGRKCRPVLPSVRVNLFSSCISFSLHRAFERHRSSSCLASGRSAQEPTDSFFQFRPCQGLAGPWWTTGQPFVRFAGFYLLEHIAENSP